MKTKLVLACLLLCGSGLFADTADSIPFLATMLPDNEVPPTAINARADALIWVHVVRDNSGAITSGSVDFNIRYTFPAGAVVTGLHIHNGAAGTNGNIVIPTDLSATNSITVGATGKGTVSKQVQVPATTSVAVIQDLLTNPQNYYVNMHTTDLPGGAIRATLQKADMTVLMGLMSPANEVPPITGQAVSGVPAVVALRAADSAWVTFDLNYTGFAADTQFTGFHIHNGAAGVNGPVIINSGIAGGVSAIPAGTNGAGALHYDIPVSKSDASFAAEMDTVNGLFSNPNNYYINIHTVIAPGGVMRAQLRNTDKMIFPVTMLPSNENPPVTDMNVTGPSKISIYSIRNADGTIAAATTIFDVNFRGFSANTTFTGLHIHNGAAGVNGPVVINTGVGADASANVTTATGSGNVYRLVDVSANPGLATVNAIALNPESAYVNIHTTVYPGGVMRSQLAAANTAIPTQNAVTSNPDVKTTNLAPGEIFSIFGVNLAKQQGDLNGTYQLTTLPTTLNGVSVTVAGKSAPLYFVGPFQINAQVPLETPTGNQPVIVTTPNGTSTAINAMIVTSAPAIYYDASNGTAAVLKNFDYSLVTANNPAVAGDVLLVYLTGLGQTTGAALKTGSLQTGDNSVTGPTTATIGGVIAPVVYSLASPGFAGLYQMAITVPSLLTGKQPLIVKTTTGTSNTVTIPLK